MDLRDTASDEPCSPADDEYDNTAGAKDSSDISSQSRREFLKMSAAAAGSALLDGCIGDDSSSSGEELGSAPFKTFDHTVVVMFENRSLDSLLGYLYTPGRIPRNQTFNGLAGAEHRCPVPPY